MTSTALTDAQKMRRLPWLVVGDVFNVYFFSLTFTGAVFVLFLDELGLATDQIGFLVSLVPLMAVTSPLVGPLARRVGYKRLFVAGRIVRTIPIGLIILTPTILDHYGKDGAFYWVSVMIFLFAVLRVISETGSFTWRKEVIPDAVRGKIAAIAAMLGRVALISVALGAGFLLDNLDGLQGFMILLGVGVGAGLASAFCFSRMPAEDPASTHTTETHWDGIKVALKDARFRSFLGVVALVFVGMGLTNSLQALFLKEQVGLSSGVVVFIGVGTHTGGLITSYFWGWSADRYSSRPTMQAGLVFMLIVPLAWMLLPRHATGSTVLALMIAFVLGVAQLAWQVSWTRYLFVNAVRATNRSGYLTIFFAWFSLSGGIGPLVAGRVLTVTESIEPSRLGLFHIDPFTPLFLTSATFFVIAIAVASQLKTESDITFRQFAGMFLQSQPVRAMRSLIQYVQSTDEMSRVIATEQMGDSHNLLNTQELIEALTDPNHSVRHEAIHSIGRMPPVSELVTALVNVLEGPESELGMEAARALGRLGDPEAIPALRRGLESRYDLIAAECARALGQLGDGESIPALSEKLRDGSNIQFKAAYASALGKLRATSIIDDLFTLLEEAQTETVKGELGLALARMMGDEGYYLRGWRTLHSNPATATAQAVLAMQRQARKAEADGLDAALEAAADHFGAEEWAAGVEQLRDVLTTVAPTQTDDALQQIMLGCHAALGNGDPTRLDLILLALHTLDRCWQDTVEE